MSKTWKDIEAKRLKDSQAKFIADKEDHKNTVRLAWHRGVNPRETFAAYDASAAWRAMFKR